MTESGYLRFIPILAVLAALMACASSGPASARQPISSAGAPALTVVKSSVARVYSLEEIKSLPAVEGWGGLMTSAGSIEGVFRQKGPAVSDLVLAVGGLDEGEEVRIWAKDGYAMTVSRRQLLEGDFVTFDCSSGKEVPHDNPTMIVSYEEDGKPVDPRIGPLRIAILAGNTQVTEGDWWVKWVNRIEVVPEQSVVSH